MSATLPASTAIPAATEATTRTAAILVATDGSDGAEAALFAASRLATRFPGGIEVLSVIEPMPIISPEAQLPISAELEEDRRVDRLATVKAQLKHVAGSDDAWPIELGAGVPAAVIARRAREVDAKLIVLGLGRHRLLDRIFGNEMALQVLRLAPVPVLCVAPGGFRWLPRRVLAAVDFSQMSADAVGAARDVIDEHATLTLAHVVSREQATGVWEQWQEIYTKALDQSFNRLERVLELPDGYTVEASTLVGDPANELLHAAESTDVDLIVTGTHGHGFLSRLLLGSVATGLVRGAKCSVLVVPRVERLAGDQGGLVESEHAPQRIALRDWSSKLDEFSKRNAGRRATLEVDDPELGAQAQETDYPLLGVAYDHRDARVEIMVGEHGHGGRHLTRSIGDVTSIDVLRDDEVDVALRIKHGAGQTLLTLPR